MNNYFYNNGTQNNYSKDDDVSNHERFNSKKAQRNTFYGNTHESYRAMDNLNCSKPYTFLNGVDSGIYRSSQGKHSETSNAHPFMKNQEKLNFHHFKNNGTTNPLSFDINNDNSYGFNNKKMNLQFQYNGKYPEGFAYGNRKQNYSQPFHDKRVNNSVKNKDNSNLLDLNINDMYDKKFVVEDEAIINPKNIFNDHSIDASEEVNFNGKDKKTDDQSSLNFLDRRKVKDLGNFKYDSVIKNLQFIEENVKAYRGIAKKGALQKMKDLQKYKEFKKGTCGLNMRKEPVFSRIPSKGVYSQKILPFDETCNNSFNIYPQSSSLLVSPYRTQMIHNLSPDFFRIPQPRNNSCFMYSKLLNHSFYKLPKIDTSFSGYHHPKSKQPNTKIKRTIRKCIILKVDSSKLYDFRYVDYTNLQIPLQINERNFISKVNEFNSSIGLPILPLKYLVSLSFIFNEIKRHRGFFNIKPCDWEKISQVVKNLVKIKEIYFFLVYPFEQMYLGNSRIRVFENKEILCRINEDFKRLNVNDIEFCILKGNVKDIEAMLNTLDPNLLNIDSTFLVLNLFVDMYNSKSTNCTRHSSSSSTYTSYECDEKCYNVISGSSKYEYYKNKDFNTENKNANETIENRVKKKLSAVETHKFIEMSKRCIDLTIEYGKICIAKYRVFDIDQEFLNKVVNILMKYKEDGYLEWSYISSFINNCSRSFYKGDSVLYMYLRKLCLTDPYLSVKIMSNVKFSKVRTKRLLRRLRKYVFKNLEEFGHAIKNELSRDRFHTFDVAQSKYFKCREDDNCRYEILSIVNGSLILDDKGILEYIVNAFYSINSMKNKFKDILLLILKYCDYNYKNKIYIKKKGSSDLFKIIARLILFKNIKDYIYSYDEITRNVKEIPGLKELL